MSGVTGAGNWSKLVRNNEGTFMPKLRHTKGAMSVQRRTAGNSGESVLEDGRLSV